MIRYLCDTDTYLHHNMDGVEDKIFIRFNILMSRDQIFGDQKALINPRFSWMTKSKLNSPQSTKHTFHLQALG
jgi:hypothetical protein